MKQCILSILFISIAYTLFANDTLIFRISNPWRPQKDPMGEYVRKALQTKDSGWLALDYDKVNVLIARGYYTDTNFTVELNCHYYFELNKGFVQEVKCFENNEMVLYAELNEKHDTIWRSSFKNNVLVNSKNFPGHESERKVFVTFQTPAKFPGGQQAWIKFLSDNLRYPDKARRKKIEGTVVVEFLVTGAGKVTEVKVAQSADPILDEEAVRLISSSPNWVPAEQNGKKVTYRQKQAISFAL